MYTSSFVSPASRGGAPVSALPLGFDGGASVSALPRGFDGGALLSALPWLGLEAKALSRSRSALVAHAPVEVDALPCDSKHGWKWNSKQQRES